MTESRPVFVLGTARSGTTWLANLLESHSKVSAVTSPLHEGIHESHLLSHTQYFFPRRLRFGDFVDRYRQEDYFRLTGLSPDGPPLDRLRDERGSVCDMFRLLMAAYAESEGTEMWIEKTPKHCVYWRTLESGFPDPLFVLIVRDVEETLNSALTRYGDPSRLRLPQVIQKAWRYYTDRAAMDSLAANVPPDRVFAVRYADLVTDRDSVVRDLCSFLGLPQEPLESRFPPNSSYSEGTAPFELTATELRVARACGRLIQLLSTSMVVGIRSAWDRWRPTSYPKYARVPR